MCAVSRSLSGERRIRVNDFVVWLDLNPPGIHRQTKILENRGLLAIQVNHTGLENRYLLAHRAHRVLHPRLTLPLARLIDLYLIVSRIQIAKVVDYHLGI